MFVTSYLKDLDVQLARFQAIDRMQVIELSHMSSDSLEMSKSLTANAITLCCSTYELTIYAMMSHYASLTGHSYEISNYFGDVNNRLIPSANMDHLADLVKKFSSKLKKEFTKSVSERERSSLQALYTNRNALAHKGGYAGLSASLSDVISWHKESKRLYRKLETRLKKAIS